jgi:hypothetical protein
MSKIRFCGRKYFSTLQPADEKFATGMPKAAVSMLLALPCNELGTSLRYEMDGLNDRQSRSLGDKRTEKNQTLIRRRCRWLRARDVN